MQIKSSLTDEWLKKIVCIHNGEVVTHKEEWNYLRLLVLELWDNKYLLFKAQFTVWDYTSLGKLGLDTKLTSKCISTRAEL
jgi:hypothetical protein